MRVERKHCGDGDGDGDGDAGGDAGGGAGGGAGGHECLIVQFVTNHNSKYLYLAGAICPSPKLVHPGSCIPPPPRQAGIDGERKDGQKLQRCVDIL